MFTLSIFYVQDSRVHRHLKFDFNSNITIYYDHLYNIPIGLVVEKPVMEGYRTRISHR